MYISVVVALYVRRVFVVYVFVFVLYCDVWCCLVEGYLDFAQS